MERKETLLICKSCSKRKLDARVGLVCSLTGEFGEFEGECKDFAVDNTLDAKEKEKSEEYNKAEIGRKKTLKVFSYLIGVSAFVTLFSFVTFKPFVTKEIIKELIQVVLQIGLFYAIYKGRNWAKATFIFLCGLGIIVSFFGMIVFLKASGLGLIFLFLIGGYTYVIYFFSKDKDFNRFFIYQKRYR